MDLTSASRFPLPAAQIPVAGGSWRKLNGLRPPRTHFIATNTITITNGMAMTATAQDKKHHLLTVIQDTQRGLLTNADQRSRIEEALVCLETSCSGAPIDLERLDGTWRLQYTSAPDVLILLDSAARFPFFQVGQIFQKFDCRDKSNGGVVYNVVKWSFPTFLEEGNGATLVVSAKFSVISSRNIYLQFEQIRFQDIYINEGLQALIAPAVLPRSFLSLQILQFIRSFRAQFPVQDQGRYRVRIHDLEAFLTKHLNENCFNEWRLSSVGGLYYLSYLDGEMLLGRAVGGGGSFVFSRAQPLQF